MSRSEKKIAIFAAGCFWGVEEIFRKTPGVVATRVGYTGGTKSEPTYREVCSGRTGHAEAIEIEFDDSQITYENLVKLFFRMHDPTTLNRQHNDIGTQYRSAIFYLDEGQRQTSQRVIEELTTAKKFSRPIVTQIVAASEFYSAEEEHQDYLQKNPGGYNCHILRPD